MNQSWVIAAPSHVQYHNQLLKYQYHQRAHHRNQPHSSTERDYQHQPLTDTTMTPTPPASKRDHWQHPSTERHDQRQPAATPAPTPTRPPAPSGATPEPSRKAQREAYKRETRKAARAFPAQATVPTPAAGAKTIQPQPTTAPIPVPEQPYSESKLCIPGRRSLSPPPAKPPASVPTPLPATTSVTTTPRGLNQTRRISFAETPHTIIPDGHTCDHHGCGTSSTDASSVAPPPQAPHHECALRL